MALRPILTYGNTKLHEIAEPVDEFDEEFQYLIDDMFETMFDADGVGLAATQIGVKKSIIVIHISNPDHNASMMTLINLEIIDSKGSAVYEEGCLSVPDITADVERPDEITVRFMDRNGESTEITADGLLARVIQHEYDHLNGILFVQKLDPSIKKAVSPQLKKLAKGIAL
ncbi:MAG: peptide deformylase [bacterium]|nr:peptide deformylase [bacterium]